MAQRTMELESFWLNLSHIVSSSPDGSMMRNMALSQLVSPSPPIETEDNIEETKVHTHTLHYTESIVHISFVHCTVSNNICTCICIV